MVGLAHVVHAAHRAFTGLIASAAFEVHGADIGRGVFGAFAVRNVLGFPGRCVLVGAVVVGMSPAAGSESKEGRGQ